MYIIKYENCLSATVWTIVFVLQICSKILIIQSHSLGNPHIYPGVPTLELIPGSEISLTCLGSAALLWTHKTAYKEFDSDRYSIFDSNFTNPSGHLVYVSHINITDINYGDVGKYSCQYLSNPELELDKNAIISSEASIYIFVLDDENLFVKSDGISTILAVKNTTLNLDFCKPTNPHVQVTISNDGDPLDSAVKYDPQKGFTISPVSSSDSGSYTCSATEANKFQQISFYIDVMDQIWEPENITLTIETKLAKSVPIGGSFSLDCLAETPKNQLFLVNWTEPADIINSGRAVIEINDNENMDKRNYKVRLTVVNVTKEDSQNPYKCILEHPLLNKTTSSFVKIFSSGDEFLNVSVLNDMNNITINLNVSDKAEWVIQIESFPTPNEFSWKNGRGNWLGNKVYSSKRFQKRFDEDSNHITLTIIGVTIADSGKYTFTVDNGFNVPQTVELFLHVKDEAITLTVGVEDDEKALEHYCEYSNSQHQYLSQMDELSCNKKFGELLSSGFQSDVNLIIGKNKTCVRVHKVILMIGSEYFKELFRNEITMKYLVILEFEPTVFLEFLKYIYTGEMTSELKFVIPLSAIAKSYRMSELENSCQARLNTSITKETAIKIFQQALEYNQSRLEDIAINVICGYADELIETPDFLELNSECLAKLVWRDNFGVKSEFQLFNFLIRWADEQYRRQGKVPNRKHYRSFLESFLPHIRFPLMNITEFSLSMAIYPDLLTGDEIVSVMIHHNIPVALRAKTPRGLFSSTPRIPMLKSFAGRVTATDYMERVHNIEINHPNLRNLGNARNGKAFFVDYSRTKTWANAKIYATSLNMTLAEILSSTESDFLSSLPDSKLSRSYNHWTGGIRDSLNSQFKWDTSGENFSDISVRFVDQAQYYKCVFLTSDRYLASYECGYDSYVLLQP